MKGRHGLSFWFQMMLPVNGRSTCPKGGVSAHGSARKVVAVLRRLTRCSPIRLIRSSCIPVPARLQQHVRRSDHYLWITTYGSPLSSGPFTTARCLHIQGGGSQAGRITTEGAMGTLSKTGLYIRTGKYRSRENVMCLSETQRHVTRYCPRSGMPWVPRHFQT